MLIGADALESDERRARNAAEGVVDLGIGENCVITGAIVDKDCRIGNNVVIDNAANIQNEDHKVYHIRDGIVVIPRGATIPHGARIPAR